MSVGPQAAPPLATPWVPLWPTGPVVAKTLPVKLTNPRATTLQGNSFFTVAGLTAWDFGHWEFVKDVDGRIYGIVRLDGIANTGNLKLSLVGANGAGVTRIGLKSNQTKDGIGINPASLVTSYTPQDVTVAAGYIQRDISFGIGGLATYTILILEIIHEGSHANDTLAVNTMLLDASFEVTG